MVEIESEVAFLQTYFIPTQSQNRFAKNAISHIGYGVHFGNISSMYTGITSLVMQVLLVGKSCREVRLEVYGGMHAVSQQ